MAEGEVTDVAAPASKLDGAELTRAKGSVIVFALAVMILSHSLMIPGLVATISAIVIGFLLAQAVV